jgi:hypothetical protein
MSHRLFTAVILGVTLLPLSALGQTESKETKAPAATPMSTPAKPAKPVATTNSNAKSANTKAVKPTATQDTPAAAKQESSGCQHSKDSDA